MHLGHCCPLYQAQRYLLVHRLDCCGSDWDSDVTLVSYSSRSTGLHVVDMRLQQCLAAMKASASPCLRPVFSSRAQVSLLRSCFVPVVFEERIREHRVGRPSSLLAKHLESWATTCYHPQVPVRCFPGTSYPEHSCRGSNLRSTLLQNLVQSTACHGTWHRNPEDRSNSQNSGYHGWNADLAKDIQSASR